MVTTRLCTLSDFAAAVARAVGRPGTFAARLILIAVWAVTGPPFPYSGTWRPIINTVPTIVTFRLVFLIQNTRNHDGAAIQAKLDELIRASAAQNADIGIEHLTEEELDSLRARCEARAKDLCLSEAADAVEKTANAKAARGSLSRLARSAGARALHDCVAIAKRSRFLILPHCLRRTDIHFVGKCSGCLALSLNNDLGISAGTHAADFVMIPTRLWSSSLPVLLIVPHTAAIPIPQPDVFLESQGSSDCDIGR
ncbi:low affinity iron permease family protein [Methylobacterium aquaticum]|uniref:low affinity iron permease family protein n=1 Tax=Methylobacterium aquaticum TaxID=270351 RepID=UPI0009E2B2C6